MVVEEEVQLADIVDVLGQQGVPVRDPVGALFVEGLEALAAEVGHPAPEALLDVELVAEKEDRRGVGVGVGGDGQDLFHGLRVDGEGAEVLPGPEVRDGGAAVAEEVAHIREVSEVGPDLGQAAAGGEEDLPAVRQGLMDGPGGAGGDLLAGIQNGAVHVGGEEGVALHWVDSFPVMFVSWARQSGPAASGGPSSAGPGGRWPPSPGRRRRPPPG